MNFLKSLIGGQDIGHVGVIREITADQDVMVEYPQRRRKWIFHPAALTKASKTFYLAPPPLIPLSNKEGYKKKWYNLKSSENEILISTI